MRAMDGRFERWIAATLLAAALAVAGCEKAEPDLAELPPPTTTETAAAPAPPGNGGGAGRGAGAETDGAGAGAAGGEPGAGARAAAIEEAVRAYIAALDARNGRAVCELLAPGTISEVKLPRRRGGCAPSLRASIGYRDPRGRPVWEGGRVGRVKARIRRNDARAVATVIARFADRDQPSVEDDVIYLVRSGRLWKIAKPSSTLYRAVGIADVPASALSPP